MTGLKIRKTSCESQNNINSCPQIYPVRWLLLGCIAHALALSFKDQAKPAKCPGVAGIYEGVLLMTNVIGSCEGIRSLLHKHQLSIYKQRKAVASHCPTRFACVHLVALDLVATKEALLAAVLDEDWDDSSSGSSHHAAFKALIVSTTQWRDLRLVIQLGQPITDAIHKLEADRGLLSQVLPVFDALAAHVDEWSKLCNVTAALKRGVVKTFKERVDKHCDDSWPAAYVLDPIHFQDMGAGKYMLDFPSLSVAQGASVTACLTQLVGPENQGALKDELARLKLASLPQRLAELCPRLVKRHDDGKGRVIVASTEERVNFWQHWASKDGRDGKDGFPLVASAAVRLLSMHTTSAASERNWSIWGQLYTKCRTHLALGRAEKLVYIKGNSQQGTVGDDEEITLSMLGE